MPEVGSVDKEHNIIASIGEHLSWQYSNSASAHIIKGRCVGGSTNFEKPLLPLCLGELEQQFVSHDQI